MHGLDFVNEYQSEVVILIFPLNLLQVFLPLILAISLLAYAVKTAIIGEISRPETLGRIPQHPVRRVPTARTCTDLWKCSRCHAFSVETIMNSIAISWKV